MIYSLISNNFYLTLALIIPPRRYFNNSAKVTFAEVSSFYELLGISK